MTWNRLTFQRHCLEGYEVQLCWRKHTTGGELWGFITSPCFLLPHCASCVYIESDLSASCSCHAFSTIMYSFPLDPYAKWTLSSFCSLYFTTASHSWIQCPWICLGLSIHMCMCLHVCPCACMCMCRCGNVCTCVCVHAYMCMCVHVCVCMHVYVCIHVNAYFVEARD